MTVGIITAVANGLLNTFRGTAYTSPAATYIKLHTADPGAAGTTSPSAVTTRQAATFTASTVGALVLSNAPAFTMTATETISHVSIWDASSAGNLLWTAALTTPKAVNATDTLTFNTLGLSLAPLAV
jgi:hypothetical protein